MSAAFDWFQHLLRNHPEVTFFLVLGLGYMLGKLKIGSFTLGAVTGTLLAGVLVGQLGLKISGEVKQCFFLLFLFSIGFRTGPQFFRGLRSDGLQQALLAAIVATTGLVVAFIVSKLFGYQAGTAAGVVAGSLTESAPIGTGSDAISRLALSDADRQMLTNQIPVAFAVTYLVGVIGAAWILGQLAPKLMGVDLPTACRELEDTYQHWNTHRQYARKQKRKPAGLQSFNEVGPGVQAYDGNEARQSNADRCAAGPYATPPPRSTRCPTRAGTPFLSRRSLR
jgi:putative transport protein